MGRERDESNSMLRACLWLLAGVYAPQLSSFHTSSDLIAGLLVAAICVWTLAGCRHALLFVAGAMLFIAAVADVVGGHLQEKFAGDSMVVDIDVSGTPRRGDADPGTWLFTAEPVADARIPARLRLSWPDAPVAVRPGDRWQVELRLRRPRGSANPGGFDAEAWMLRERVQAQGYVVPGHRNRLLDSDRLSGLMRLRLAAAERIERVLGNGAEAAVVQAIAVGMRDTIRRDRWEAYARTGTSHLMAISGLHVGLAATAVYGLVAAIAGLLRPRRGSHDIALAAAALAAGGYVAFTGFGIPGQRAVLMLVAVLLVIGARRSSSPWTVVAAVAAIVLLADPLASLAPGFLLSFGAVLVLIQVAAGGDSVSRSGPRRWLGALRKLATVQLLLLAGLLPLTALLFQRVSLVAPVVNLAVVPLFSLVTVPLALLHLVLCGPFEWLGDRSLEAAAASIRISEWLIDVADRGPASVHTASFTGFAAGLLLLPLAALLPAGWPGRMLGVLGIAVVAAWAPPPPPPGCLRLDALDVGQGQALILRTHRHTFIYDTGPAWRSGADAGERVLVPYLRSQGIRRIDAVFVSHADVDHSGGLMSVAQRIPVAAVVAGEPLPQAPVPPSRCLRAAAYFVDGVRFRVLHPTPDSGLSGNDLSCVLRLDAGEHGVLLTGDIERAAETTLVHAGLLRPATLVSVPHHGSRTSSSLPFVVRIDPDFALVSAGHANRWGFPKADVVERWQRTGGRVVATADSGALRFEFCPGIPFTGPTSQRLADRRFWRR